MNCHSLKFSKYVEYLIKVETIFQVIFNLIVDLILVIMTSHAKEISARISTDIIYIIYIDEWIPPVHVIYIT